MLDVNTEVLLDADIAQIFNEEVYDLLDPTSSKRPTVARAPIQIRETLTGGISLHPIPNVMILRIYKNHSSEIQENTWLIQVISSVPFVSKDGPIALPAHETTVTSF